MTQSQVLLFILRHTFGVSAGTLIGYFGPQIEQTVYDLLELGLIYDYTNGKGAQMFAVCRRWRWER